METLSIDIFGYAIGNMIDGMILIRYANSVVQDGLLELVDGKKCNSFGVIIVENIGV